MSYSNSSPSSSLAVALVAPRYILSSSGATEPASRFRARHAKSGLSDSRLPTPIILGDAAGGLNPRAPIAALPSLSIVAVIASFWLSVTRVSRICTSKRTWRTICYLAKCAARPLASLRWIVALERSPLQQFLDRQPRLLLKPYRPYISRQYDFQRRTAALLNHYALAFSLCPAGTTMDMLAGRTHALAEIIGKNGIDRYQLTVAKTDRFDREGELILSLKESLTGEAVQVLVFSFALRDSMPCIEIGCLQGGRAALSQACIKQATKALHGIRPKNLLLDAIYALSRGWKVARIFGISNASRVFFGACVYSDYDEFWSELGGVADRDGFFALPATLPQKIAIPSNRRAEYRRRTELRLDMDAQIQKSMGTAHVMHRSGDIAANVGGTLSLAEAA
jgi:uncharacterized protein VirK/YbjX